MSGFQTALGTAFLVIMMFAIGLQVELREMVCEVRRYRLVAKALLANLVLVPLLGIAIIVLFHLKGEVAAGFLILALAPGAPFAVNFSSKVRGAINVAASLLFVLVVAAVIYTPLVANLILPTQAQISLPYGRVAGEIMGFLLLPFAVGLALKNRAGRLAEAFLKPATILAVLTFVGFLLLTASTRKEAKSIVGSHNILAMLAFIAGAMLIGWLVGGPDRANRQVMAVSTSMRNVAVAMLLVQSLGSETARMAVIAFFSLMLPCNALLAVYEKIRLKKERRRAEQRSSDRENVVSSEWGS